MKTPPKGLGFWIAFPEQIGGPSAVVAALQRVGAEWVAPRIGQGGWRNHEWTADHQMACIDAGLPVYGWIYSMPKLIAKEVDTFAASLASGASGCIIDAEIQWGTTETRSGPVVGGVDPATARDLARMYVHAFRAGCGDAWLATAPWPWVKYHPVYPAAAFGTGGGVYCDAALPQAYPPEIGVTYDLCRSRMVEHWGRTPIHPIGATYGRSDIQRLGGTQLPPRDVVVDDVLRHILEAPGEYTSLYSLEAMGPDVSTALHARADRIRVDGPDTYRPPPDLADPIGAFASEAAEQIAYLENLCGIGKRTE